MYRLIFLSGRMKGRRLAVKQGTLVIGRDPGCQVDLSDDDQVSRHHAQLELRRDGVWLKDLGALNRATVNGEPVDEVKLRAGDKIDVGHTQIEFQPLEAVVHTPHRRRSRIHLMTLCAVGGLLLLQAFFIVIFPLWQRGYFGGSPPPGAETAEIVAALTNEPAPGITTNDTALLDEAAKRTHVGLEPPPLKVEQTGDVASAAMQSEVAALKEVVTGLKEQLQALTTQVVETAVAPPEPAPPSTSPPPVAVATQAPAVVTAPASDRPAETDPLAERERELLALAQTEFRKGNYVTADQALERLLILSPDHVPGLVERARTYEKRGLLREAGETWARLLNLTGGTPLYAEAAAERQRLAREEARLAMLKQETSGGAGTRPGRRIRIVSVDRERFQSSREFDEMRALRINLKPRMGEGRVDVDDVEVRVAFFDRVVGRQELVPTGAKVPDAPLRIDTAWDGGEQKSVTATYIVPLNFRADEEARTGQKRVYEGYRVQVWYKGELQDEEALPRALQKKPMPALRGPAEASPPTPSAEPRTDVNAPMPRR